MLFTEWWGEFGRRMDGKSRWATPWSEQRPLDTPAGISDPAVAVAALDAAVSTVQSRYGAIDVPWGDVYRLRRDSLDLPANGAPDILGVFRVVSYAPAGGNRFRAVSGDSYFATIEFSSPLRAMSLVGYGNASRAGSPHRTDQLPLFARKELKPVWRTRADVEAHTELREKF
jgi:acyl-homoserine-lactone acylase